MEVIKKYPKLFQWLFLLVVFFALCFSIDVPETYKFIRGQAEFIKDPNQSTFVFPLARSLSICSEVRTRPKGLQMRCFNAQCH